jgi:glycosyltransferase involved in cell wall biosynthesis
MKSVAFIELPPRLRTGGLEAACSGLATALGALGVQVMRDWDGTPPDPDVVHVHGLWNRRAPRIVRACRRRGIPCIVSPHGMLEAWAWRKKWWKKWPYFLLVERRMLRRAAGLLATSRIEARTLARRLPAAHITALPLGTHEQIEPDHAGARARLGWEADCRVLLYLSRLHEKKGLHLLLQALAAGGAGLGRARLAIVGDGAAAYLRHCRELAAAAPGNIQIDWHGAVWGAARWDYYRGADLFCLPTHSENFGLAVLEACQAGTPVLVGRDTPWGALAERGWGYVVEPAVGAVQTALASWAAGIPWSAAQRAELARWAHASFAWEHIAPEYLEAYKKLREDCADAQS